MLWLLAVFGCGSPVHCEGATDLLATTDAASLTCGQADHVLSYLDLLAGRPVPQVDRDRVRKAVRARFEDDPAGTVAWLQGMSDVGFALANQTGLSGAEARATTTWKAQAGEDLIKPGDGELWNIQKRTLSVWTKDDEERLAFTEADLEGWIRYASLCREVQGSAVLRISVADRVAVYRMLIDRFNDGDRASQVGLSALGGWWRAVPDKWDLASYEDQQGWMAVAPLPPPMMATSLGYAEAIFTGDVARHAAALGEALGPMRVGRAERFTAAKPPPQP